MTNGGGSLYGTIKAQEAKFPLPMPSLTVKIGTWDVAETDPSKSFTFASPDLEYEKTTFVGSTSGWPKGHVVTQVGLQVAVLNVVNVTLSVDVLHRRGPVTLGFFGGPSITADEDTVRIDVGSATELGTLSLQSGGISWATQLRTNIDHPLVGAGAFSIPALPVAIVYAPPIDQQKLNTASYADSRSVGTTSSFSFSDAQSTTKPAPSEFQATNNLAAGMQAVASVLNKSKNPYAQAAAAALNLIAGGLGSSQANSTDATILTTDQSLTVIDTSTDTLQTNPAAGGPGSGDVIVFLRNAQLVWFASGGQLSLALIGHSGIGSLAAEIFKAQPQRTGLDSATIHALLNLDAAQPAETAPGRDHRFVFEEAYQVGGVEQAIGFSHSVTDEDSSVSASSTIEVVDERKGWLSFLGLGPSETKTTQTTLTYRNSVTRAVNQTESVSCTFNAGPDEVYGVAVYYDVIWGTFAFTGAAFAPSPVMSGVVSGPAGRPAARQLVTLVNGGAKFSTMTDVQGRYAFSFKQIQPGPCTLAAGTAKRELQFTGAALEHLDLAI